MTNRSDPFWNRDASASLSVSEQDISTLSSHRLFEAYARGSHDAHLGLKDNPYPETSGLFDAYEEGWRDRVELSA